MVEFLLKYWLEVLLGLFTASLVKVILGYKATRAGLQALLRDRLIQSYNYHTSKGCCAIHDRDNVLNMYEQYHHLGANGVVDGLMDELLKLPVTKC